MRAGKLRHLVTAVEDRETGRDSFGTQDTEPITIGQFWASIQPLRGRELFDSRQVMPETTHRIVCRQQRRLTAKSRIEFEGRTFELLEPPRDFEERGVMQEFFVAERPKT